MDLLNNELVVTNFGAAGGDESITVFARTANGNTAPLRTITGAATGMNGPEGLAVDIINNELVVANTQTNLVTVYSRTANGNTAPIRSVSGSATGLSFPSFLAVSTPPAATVSLNGVAFRPGTTITSQAKLTPGPSPAKVDIYLGCLLPDGVTFLSLVQSSPGVTSIALGPAPVPFLANTLLTPTVVPVSYPFTGTEPLGSYFVYAGLAVAGSNPFVASNQLSLSIQGFMLTP